MKAIRIVVLVIIIISSFVGCHKAPKCWGKKMINSGLIESDTVVCSNCTMVAEEEKQFVINNQAAMNKLIYYNYGNNPSCHLNAIDFTKYTLLGVNTIATCKYKIEKDVTLNAETKTYIYLIKITECGNCSEQAYLQNWVLIPKVKSGHNVEFVIERY